MSYTKEQLDALEEREMRLHRIKKGLISFQSLALPVFKAQAMSYEQYLDLQVAAIASNDYNDSLTLNKLTIMFPVPSLN